MKLILTILISGLYLTSYSQNRKMTGTWQGQLRDEFLQVNIVEGNGRLCGYTWDYVLNDRASYCKAYFTATYDPLTIEWYFTGISFIETSGDHVLMRMHYKPTYDKKAPMLKGFAGEKLSVFSFIDDSMMDYVELRKVSNKPAQIYPFMQDCLNETKRKPKKITPVKQTPAKPVIQKKVPPKRVDMPPPQKKDTTLDISIKKAPPAARKKENEEAITKMIGRKRIETSHLLISVRHIELKVYDDGVVDGDIVSIFYNGRLIAGKKRLTEKPIIIPLDLDENTNIHEITLFAENMGSIPPNTALIIVTAGDKRYELRSSETLDTNAVLVFEYKQPN